MSEMLQEITINETDTQHGKFLTFSLGKEVFGIEILYVTGIVGIQKVTDLPESPDYVKGIINLRGKIIPVIDMRLRFRKKAVPYTDRTCIIVIDILDMTVGLIVDQVDEVITIPDESIVPPPEFRTGFKNRYIKGIGKVGDDIRLLLDCERLFRDEEIETLNQIKG
jgi:purine-binding chemotaxis protein CheW